MLTVPCEPKLGGTPTPGPGTCEVRQLRQIRQSDVHNRDGHGTRGVVVQERAARAAARGCDCLMSAVRTASTSGCWDLRRRRTGTACTGLKRAPGSALERRNRHPVTVFRTASTASRAAPAAAPTALLTGFEAVSLLGCAVVGIGNRRRPSGEDRGRRRGDDDLSAAHRRRGLLCLPIEEPLSNVQK